MDFPHFTLLCFAGDATRHGTSVVSGYYQSEKPNGIVEGELHDGKISGNVKGLQPVVHILLFLVMQQYPQGKHFL